MSAVDDLIAKALALTPPPGGRAVFALVGGPGAGKSTLAAQIMAGVEAARPGWAALLPMDGFHRRNPDLAAAGLSHRKGAPETFDAAGYAALLAQARSGAALRAPTYSRAIEEVVDDALPIPASARLLIIEGNYLLLEAPEWRGLRAMIDFAAFLDLPRDVAERRLLARHGAEPDQPRSPEQIRAHVDSVDLPNFDLVAASKGRADHVIQLSDTW